MLALQVFRDGTPPSRPIRDWTKVYIAWWQGLTNRLPSLVWGCFLTRISFCLRRKQSQSSRNHDLNFTMRCSRPRFFVEFEFQVCPEPYLSLENNFIFIADYEHYRVDVNKKGSINNTLHMRTGLWLQLWDPWHLTLRRNCNDAEGFILDGEADNHDASSNKKKLG